MVSTTQLIEIFSLHYPFMDENELKEASLLFETKHFKKGDLLISKRGVCKTCHFLVNGFVRCYTTDGETESTLWFGERGDLLTSFKSLFDNMQGDDMIVALTDCEVFTIDMDAFKNLVKTNAEFTKLYIKIIEVGYQFWENRFKILSQMDVERRYNEWQGRTKHLEAHIPLGVIAQYLNINQATLSRIRAKKK